jgi:hypothetical protein
MNRLPDRSHAAWLLSDNLNLRRPALARLEASEPGGVDATVQKSNSESDLIKL